MGSMKTTRRGFFAMLMAPLLGRLMPKPELPWWKQFLQCPQFMRLLDEATLTEEDFDYPSLNGFAEALDNGICPDWDGNIYPTYGSISRNGWVRELTPPTAANYSLAAQIELKMKLAERGLRQFVKEDLEPYSWKENLET